MFHGTRAEDRTMHFILEPTLLLAEVSPVDAVLVVVLFGLALFAVGMPSPRR